MIFSLIAITAKNFTTKEMMHTAVNSLRILPISRKELLALGFIVNCQIAVVAITYFCAFIHSFFCSFTQQSYHQAWYVRYGPRRTYSSNLCCGKSETSMPDSKLRY